jgi:hypothetical protein
MSSPLTYTWCPSELRRGGRQGPNAARLRAKHQPRGVRSAQTLDVCLRENRKPALGRLTSVALSRDEWLLLPKRA